MVSNISIFPQYKTELIIDVSVRTFRGQWQIRFYSFRLQVPSFSPFLSFLNFSPYFSSYAFLSEIDLEFDLINPSLSVTSDGPDSASFVNIDSTSAISHLSSFSSVNLALDCWISKINYTFLGISQYHIFWVNWRLKLYFVCYNK